MFKSILKEQDGTFFNYLCVPVTRSFERVNEHLDSTKNGGLLEWLIIWLLKKSCGLHGAGY
jgi:hypothetical protein